MQQKDMERFAFLYLCGQKDRDMLNGKERMTFQDFDRLVYITDVLGLDQMNIEICNRFFKQFKEQFEALGWFLEENCGEIKSGECEGDVRIHDKWFSDFCDSAPEDEAREILINIFDIFHEKE